MREIRTSGSMRGRFHPVPISSTGRRQANSKRGLKPFELHGISQLSDFFHLDRDGVAWLEPAGRIRRHSDPVRRSGRIVVPGRRVVLPLRNSMIEGTSKIMSLVFQSWTVVPFRIVRMARVLGLGIGRELPGRGRAEKRSQRIFRGSIDRLPSSSASPARSRRWRKCIRARNPRRCHGTRFYIAARSRQQARIHSRPPHWPNESE